MYCDFKYEIGFNVLPSTAFLSFCVVVKNIEL